MILQLSPPLPLRTPKGEGLAHIVTDYGPEHDLLWTVFITSTGECWTFSNREVRATKNITMGRTDISPYYDPNDVAIGLSDDHSGHPWGVFLDVRAKVIDWMNKEMGRDDKEIAIALSMDAVQVYLIRTRFSKETKND